MIYHKIQPEAFSDLYLLGLKKFILKKDTENKLDGCNLPHNVGCPRLPRIHPFGSQQKRQRWTEVFLHPPNDLQHPSYRHHLGGWLTASSWVAVQI